MKGQNGERDIGERCLEEDLRMPLECEGERLKQRVGSETLIGMNSEVP